VRRRAWAICADESYDLNSTGPTSGAMVHAKTNATRGGVGCINLANTSGSSACAACSSNGSSSAEARQRERHSGISRAVAIRSSPPGAARVCVGGWVGGGGGLGRGSRDRAGIEQGCAGKTMSRGGTDRRCCRASTCHEQYGQLTATPGYAGSSRAVEKGCCSGMGACRGCVWGRGAARRAVQRSGGRLCGRLAVSPRSS